MVGRLRRVGHETCVKLCIGSFANLLTRRQILFGALAAPVKIRPARAAIVVKVGTLKLIHSIAPYFYERFVPDGTTIQIVPRYVGDMSESDTPLRQQIDEGMKAIHHQLERLREGPTMGDPSDDRILIARLEAEYQALKKAQDGLGRRDHAARECDGDTVD